MKPVNVSWLNWYKRIETPRNSPDPAQGPLPRVSGSPGRSEVAAELPVGVCGSQHAAAGFADRAIWAKGGISVR